MKKIMFLGIALSFALSCFSQNEIILGKSSFHFFRKRTNEYRKTSFWKYQIGSLKFKLNETGDYQKAGFLGKNLKPYLKDNEAAFRYYKRFRTKKALAYIGDVGTGVFLLLWMNASLENGNTSGGTISNMFINKKNTAWYLMSYFASAYGAIGLRVGGENDLLVATLIHNGRIKQSIQKPSIQLGANLLSIPTLREGVIPSLSMRLKF